MVDGSGVLADKLLSNLIKYAARQAFMAGEGKRGKSKLYEFIRAQL